jgi:hypothetical protein
VGNDVKLVEANVKNPLLITYEKKTLDTENQLSGSVLPTKNASPKL